MATKRKATNTKSRSKSVKTQQRSAKTKSNDLPALESWADMFVRDVRDYELTELAHSDERYYIEAGFGRDCLKLKTIREILSDLKHTVTKHEMYLQNSRTLLLSSAILILKKS